MRWRYVVVTALVATGLTGCAGDPTRPAGGSDDPADGVRGARHAVESYVAALNARDADRLIEVGGVPDDRRARREAGRILAATGGRELSVVDVRISFDMGPDVASAKLTAEDGAGAPLHETFTVLRTGDGWHVIAFADRPAPPGKQPASTTKP
ncbi:hypothetical protein ACMA1D_16180 [Streptomyces sp. 796.1]|uniref:hypothetical protein n=1 Tax=Streptomyces sp. 796.1 TaxID=3163029 RepID=UPI0039C9DD2B